MAYNALDNLESAKKLREQLILENQDIGSSLEYDYATGWCDNCPRGRSDDDEPGYYSDGWPRHYASSCCKEDGMWDEENASSLKKQADIRELLKALSAYIGDEPKPQYSEFALIGCSTCGATGQPMFGGVCANCFASEHGGYTDPGEWVEAMQKDDVRFSDDT